MMTTLQKTVVLLSVALALALIYLLQPILAPFLAGMFLAYLGDPLVDRLEARKIRRTLGVLIVFTGFFTFFAILMLVVAPLIGGELGALIRDLPLYARWLQETTGPFMLETLGVDPFDIRMDDIGNRLRDNWQEAGGVVGAIFGYMTRSGMAFLTALGSLALTPVVAFYMMRDWNDIMAGARAMIPRRVEARVVGLARQCDEVLAAFLRGQLLIMFLLGCIYSTGLFLIGLELALLIGILAGLMSIVPYLGFIVGIAAALLTALFQFQDLMSLVYVALVFGFGQLLEGSVLTPWLVGDRIGLHPVAVIFAVLAGGQLFGFTGILLALPLAAVVMVFVRHLHRSYIASGYYNPEADL